MLIKIRSRWTGEVLFEKDCGSLKFCVEAAVAARADLSDADLRGANLRGANLCGANLCGADLCDAILRDANLCGADLCDAILRDADLSDADLRGAILWGADLRYADLRYADLGGADLGGADLRYADLRYADLGGADLRGAILRDANLRGAILWGADPRDIPVIEDIHKAVYAAASQPGALDMSTWHEDGHCGTTHCRAGWVTALAGKKGKVLEDKIGTAAAATLIYLKSDPKLDRVPDFYCDNAKALADMKRLAKVR